MSQPLDVVDLFGRHVLQQLDAHQVVHSGHNGSAMTTPPLFVAMQGPQGSGKTTIAKLLSEYLRQRGIRIAVLSTDDLYHTHDNLKRIACENDTNRLLAGRGLPGTHDIPLGRSVLDSVAIINQSNHSVILPHFDKSLFGGEGDRVTLKATEANIAQPPLDVFVLEGWSMGFGSVPSDQVEVEWNQAPPHSPLKQYSLQELLQINTLLQDYVDQWYSKFTVFLQIQPLNLDYVYQWRLEQEHKMMAANGGQGMTDEQVKAFIDRYMPGYYLFLDTIQHNPCWKGRGKSVLIDRQHKCIEQQDW